MNCSLHKCASEVSRLSPWHRCHTVEAPFHTLLCAAPTGQELCSNRGAASGGSSSQLRAWLCVPWLTNTLFTSISGIFHTCPQTNTHLTRAEVRLTTHQRNISVLLLWLFSLRSSSHFTDVFYDLAPLSDNVSIIPFWWFSCLVSIDTSDSRFWNIL